MKLLITFNYFEAEFLLKKAKILKEEIIFKDKKQQSKLYVLELFNKEFYFAFLGITQTMAMPSLQRVIDRFNIDGVLMFGTAGSYDYNVGKLVILNSFSYKNDILNKYFSINTKIPKWLKKSNNLPKLEIFESISVNDIEKPDKSSANLKICFDMESSEMAYLLKINKINAVFFRIITDFGEIDFEQIKKVYNTKIEDLLKFIELFLKN